MSGKASAEHREAGERIGTILEKLRAIFWSPEVIATSDD
jgi:hypothetical protein